jgi:hypothetical protein
MSILTDALRWIILPFAWSTLQSKFERVILRDLPIGYVGRDELARQIAADCVTETKGTIKFK